MPIPANTPILRESLGGKQATGPGNSEMLLARYLQGLHPELTRICGWALILLFEKYVSILYSTLGSALGPLGGFSFIIILLVHIQTGHWENVLFEVLQVSQLTFYPEKL